MPTKLKLYIKVLATLITEIQLDIEIQRSVSLLLLQDKYWTISQKSLHASTAEAFSLSRGSPKAEEQIRGFL